MRIGASSRMWKINRLWKLRNFARRAYTSKVVQASASLMPARSRLRSYLDSSLSAKALRYLMSFPIPAFSWKRRLQMSVIKHLGDCEPYWEHGVSTLPWRWLMYTSPRYCPTSRVKHLQFTMRLQLNWSGLIMFRNISSIALEFRSLMPFARFDWRFWMLEGIWLCSPLSIAQSWD